MIAQSSNVQRKSLIRYNEGFQATNEEFIFLNYVGIDDNLALVLED